MRGKSNGSALPNKKLIEAQLARAKASADQLERMGHTDTHWHTEVKRLTAALKQLDKAEATNG